MKFWQKNRLNLNLGQHLYNDAQSLKANIIAFNFRNADRFSSFPFECPKSKCVGGDTRQRGTCLWPYRIFIKIITFRDL